MHLPSWQPVLELQEVLLVEPQEHLQLSLLAALPAEEAEPAMAMRAQTTQMLSTSEPYPSAR